MIGWSPRPRFMPQDAWSTVNPDSIAWVPIKYFLQDEVELAHSTALETGVGSHAQSGVWFRIIEAEYLTRQVSVIVELNEWLSFEYIPEELGDRHAQASELILNGCDLAAQRLQHRHQHPTLVSILAADTNAPWLEGKFGYFIDKVPYGKICLPLVQLDSAEEFKLVVAHEYAHAICTRESEGAMSRSMQEAISTLMGGEATLEARDAFSKGSQPWLNPKQLDMAFNVHQSDTARFSVLWYAYQQSAWIGRYLSEIGGETSLGQFVKAFKEMGFWTRLSLSVFNRTATDEALVRVYDMAGERLFRQALDWIKKTA